MVLVAETLPDGDESTVILTQEQRDTWLNTDLTEPQAKEIPLLQKASLYVFSIWRRRVRGQSTLEGWLDRGYANFGESPFHALG